MFDNAYSESSLTELMLCYQFACCCCRCCLEQIESRMLDYGQIVSRTTLVIHSQSYGTFDMVKSASSLYWELCWNECDSLMRWTTDLREIYQVAKLHCTIKHGKHNACLIHVIDIPWKDVGPMKFWLNYLKLPSNLVTYIFVIPVSTDRSILPRF